MYMYMYFQQTQPLYTFIFLIVGGELSLDSDGEGSSTDDGQETAELVSTEPASEVLSSEPEPEPTITKSG